MSPLCNARSSRVWVTLGLGLAGFLTVGLSRVARAGGFETLETSPAGTGTVGARTAIADDADAVFYNPAGLAMQRGLGVIGGANVLHIDGTVTPTGGASVSSTGTVATPTGYLSARIGPHFGVGVGVFSNFAEHLEYPAGFSGRALGTFLDLTTTTVNPSVALRPIPQVSVGFGLDVMAASLDWRHASLSAGGEGLTHSSTTAVGLGANVGLLVRLVPRWLTFGFSYRSATTLDFAGSGGLDGPGLPAQRLDAKVTMALPHNFSFALATRPTDWLTVDAEAHLSLWSDLHTLTFRFVDPSAPSGTQPTVDAIDANLRDSVGVRAGAEARLLSGRLPLRLGLGFDTSPVRRGWLQPLFPDSNRVLVGLGAGYHFGAFGVELGYAVEVLLDRPTTYPFFAAHYSAVRQVISLALTARFDDLGVRVDLPEYKH